METEFDWHSARAALEWQMDLGVTETLLDAPVNRFAAPPTDTPAPAAVSASVAKEVNPVDVARGAATEATSLGALSRAMSAYPHCDLRKGARNTVFADGNPAARVMIIGEAPGRDEDRQGKPFVGRAGQLLDRMFGAIGLSRSAADPAAALYITNVLPWRPPQNRDPRADEIAMLIPFLRRHIELADPEILVIMGNISCQAVLGRRGITRLRGQWADALGKPTLPMFHPAYLLRQASAKREAWADLLELNAKLKR